jgi:hypothetical protein
MSSPKKLAVILVLMIATAVFAQTPGLITLSLNDSLQTPLTRVNYAADGVGWGVKFNPFSADANLRYIELTGADVRLCPPPMDGYYQEKIVIVKAVSGVPDMSQVVWASDPFDVRVGYWWHHVDIPSIWITAPQQLVVFALVVQGHAYMYQFFDGMDNAAAGTQWYFDGTTAKRDHTAGDIMINLTYKKHDWAATGIVQPTTRTFTPVGRIQNITGFNEPVDVRFWVTKGSNIVYDQTKLSQTFGGLGEYNVSFPTATLPSGHVFKCHCQVQYHPAGHVYPFGERYVPNDQWNLQFEIYPFGTTPQPGQKND